MLRKLFSSVPKWVCEKIDVFVEKKSILLLIYQTVAGISTIYFPVFGRNIFSSFVGRPWQFFGINWGENFCENKIFPFVVPSTQFRGFRKSTFWSAFKTSFHVSGRISWRIFFLEEKKNVMFFLGPWAEEFKFVSENIKRYCQKW